LACLLRASPQAASKLFDDGAKWSHDDAPVASCDTDLLSWLEIELSRDPNWDGQLHFARDSGEFWKDAIVFHRSLPAGNDRRD
jgi:hypothetical protein